MISRAAHIRSILLAIREEAEPLYIIGERIYAALKDYGDLPDDGFSYSMRDHKYLESIDTIIGLIERGPLYRANPVEFMSSLAGAARSTEVAMNWTDPQVPQIARQLTIAYLRIVLAAEDSADLARGMSSGNS